MLTFRIAVRYLLAKKSHSAINAITIVAAVGVAIITAALVCVLSVYNGFESLVGKLTSRLDPELIIEAAEGKFFHDDPTVRNLIACHPGVEQLSATLTENVLIINSGRQTPARMKGVDSVYEKVTMIDSILWNGSYQLKSEVADFAILGIGLSQQVACRPGFLRPMTFYCPRRTGKINLLNPEDAFIEHDFFCSAQFAVQQSDYDDDLCLVDIQAARQLLQDSLLCSAYELKLRPGFSDVQVKKDLLEQISGFRILTRNEQQADSYRIVQIEKWLTFLLILFILIIASFNLIGALSMLIIDKESDIRTLRCLGASDLMIRRIFAFEGWLVTGCGALVGIIVGVLLCFLQQHFGIVSLGDSSDIFVVDSYPVLLSWTDVVWVALSVCGTGFLITLFTTRNLSIK